jgi:para-nitrobenzyl esterase
MPEDLYAAISGGAQRVPLIVGTNRHEWTLFSQLSPEFAWQDDAVTRQQLEAAFGEHAETLIAAYHGAPDLLGTSLQDAADAILGDAAFRLPSICLAQAQAQHSPTYMYLLDHRSPRRQGKLGATHGIELPLVFGTLDSPTGQYLLRDTPETRALSQHLIGLWAEFARTGQPRGDGLDWPAYDARDRATLLLSAAQAVLRDPWSAQRRAWQGSDLFAPCS